MFVSLHIQSCFKNYIAKLVTIAFFLRIRTMPCTLLIILIIPKDITKARAVAAIGREYSASQRRNLIAANGGLLMLMDVLDGIQSLGDSGHE